MKKLILLQEAILKKAATQSKKKTSGAISTVKDMVPFKEMKRIDDILISTIVGLDLLIAKAAAERIGTITRVLHEAKEDLVF